MNKINIITNGYYENDYGIYQASRIKEECLKLGFDVEITKNNRDLRDIECDTAIFLDKDIDLALNLESKGIKVCNNGKAIEICDNKILTLSYLKDTVKIPDYIKYPFQYFYKLDLDFIEIAEKKIGYPLVIKEAMSSLGLGVYLSHNRSETLEIIEKIKGKSFYFQKFISESSGKSYRVYAIKDKVLRSMYLENERDFKSNSYAGGKGKEIVLSKKFDVIALNIMKKLNLNFAGIDFFALDDPLLIEVNSNAYFKELENTYKCNIAKEIVNSCIK